MTKKKLPNNQIAIYQKLRGEVNIEVRYANPTTEDFSVVQKKGNQEVTRKITGQVQVEV